MSFYPFYTIHYPKYWFINDKQSKKYSHSFKKNDPSKNMNLLFHISSNDYFGTLATTLSLIKESLTKKENSSTMKNWQLDSLQNTKNDLIFLQKYYRITKK
ncbi:MAG: hypothetical protein WCX79_03255 [Candidatus Paceibacterota bacterium]|jgi:hypothetical protein